PGCDPEPLRLGDRQPAGQLGEPAGLAQPHPGRRLRQGDRGTDPHADPAAGRYGDAGPGQGNPAERAEPPAVSSRQARSGRPAPDGAGLSFAAHPAGTGLASTGGHPGVCPHMSQILLSTNSLARYAGSELVTYEIAQYLVECGHSVTVATFIKDGDIRRDFDALGIQWIDLSAARAPLETRFDLFWGHHASCFDALLLERNLSVERVIFSSLSPYEPLECPPLYAGSLTHLLANSPRSEEHTSELQSREK